MEEISYFFVYCDILVKIGILNDAAYLLQGVRDAAVELLHTLVAVHAEVLNCVSSTQLSVIASKFSLDFSQRPFILLLQIQLKLYILNILDVLFLFMTHSLIWINRPLLPELLA